MICPTCHRQNRPAWEVVALMWLGGVVALTTAALVVRQFAEYAKEQMQ